MKEEGGAWWRQWPLAPQLKGGHVVTGGHDCSPTQHTSKQTLANPTPALKSSLMITANNSKEKMKML